MRLAPSESDGPNNSLYQLHLEYLNDDNTERLDRRDLLILGKDLVPLLRDSNTLLLHAPRLDNTITVSDAQAPSPLLLNLLPEPTTIIPTKLLDWPASTPRCGIHRCRHGTIGREDESSSVPHSLFRLSVPKRQG